MRKLRDECIEGVMLSHPCDAAEWRWNKLQFKNPKAGLFEEVKLRKSCVYELPCVLLMAQLKAFDV